MGGLTCDDAPGQDVPRYAELPVPDGLRHGVEAIWCSSFSHAPTPRFIECRGANLAPHLVVSLGTAYGVRTGKKDSVEIQGHALFGPRTGPTWYEHRASNVLIGARFRPGTFGGLRRVLRGPELSTLAHLAELDSLPPGPPSAHDGQIVRWFIGELGRLATVEALAHPVVDDALRYFAHNLAHRPTVTRVAKALAITPKSLYRYFLQAAGVTPKVAFSVVRARLALASYLASSNRFCAYDFGYADSHHFYREVQRRVGERPAALRARQDCA